MSKKVLLISQDEIKQQTNIEKNVDAKVLSKTIITVQETKLKAILGAELYTNLLNEVFLASTGHTLSTLHKELLEDYIQPYLSHAVVCDFIILNNYKFTDKGVLKLNDNSASTVNADEIEQMKNYYDQYAVTYKIALIRFLEENNLIQLHSTDTDVTSESIGWFLDSSHGCHGSHTSTNNGSSAEADPVWQNQKNFYYTKTEVDALFDGLGTGTTLPQQDLQSVTDISNVTSNGIIIGDNEGVNLTLASTFEGEADPRIIFQKSEGLVGIHAANVQTNYDVILPAYAGGGSVNLPLMINGQEADGVGNINVPVENFVSVDLVATEDRTHTFNGHDVTLNSLKKFTIKGGNNTAEFIPSSEDVYFNYSQVQNWLRLTPLSEDAVGEAGQILRVKFLIGGEEKEYDFTYQNLDDGNSFWYFTNIPTIFNEWLINNGGDPEGGVNEFLGYTRFSYLPAIINIEAETTEYDSSKPFIYVDANGDLKSAIIPSGGGGGNYIPLAGTTDDSPITGDLKFLTESIHKIYTEDEYGNHNSITFWDDPTLTLENKFNDVISQVQLQGSAALMSRDTSTDNRTNLDVASNRFMVENVGEETVRIRLQEGQIIINGNVIADNRITADRVKIDTSLVINEGNDFYAYFFHDAYDGGAKTIVLRSDSGTGSQSGFRMENNFVNLNALNSDGLGIDVNLQDGIMSVMGNVEIKESGTLTFEGVNIYTEEAFRTTLTASSNTDVLLPYLSGQLPVFDVSNTIDFRDSAYLIVQSPEGYLGIAQNIPTVRTLVDESVIDTTYNGFTILDSIKQTAITSNPKKFFTLEYIYSFERGTSDSSGSIDLLFVIRNADGSIRSEKVVEDIALQPYSGGYDDSNPDNPLSPMFIEINGAFGNYVDNHNCIKITGDNIYRTARIHNGDFDGTVHSELYYKKHGSYTGSVTVRKYTNPILTQRLIREF